MREHTKDKKRGQAGVLVGVHDFDSGEAVNAKERERKAVTAV
jgi:hypothetical protein